jgi:hypothetical protein
LAINHSPACCEQIISLKGWNNKAQGNAGVALGCIVSAFQAASTAPLSRLQASFQYTF